jgi:hypothetical protein
MTVKWNQIYTDGIALPTTAKINALLFVNNQVITVDSEDSLQGRVFYIVKHCKILEWIYYQQNLRLWQFWDETQQDWNHGG